MQADDQQSGLVKKSLSLSGIILIAGCSTQEIPKNVTLCDHSICPGSLRPYEVKGVWYTPQKHYELEEIGIASFYGVYDNEHGNANAMGDIYNRYEMTAAHKTLPLPCVVEVTNLENGRKAILTVKDRGPYIPGRVIDLSYRAAECLGLHKKGTALVKVKALVAQSILYARYYKNYKKNRKNSKLFGTKMKPFTPCLNFPSAPPPLQKIEKKKPAPLPLNPPPVTLGQTTPDKRLRFAKKPPIHIIVYTTSFDRSVWLQAHLRSYGKVSIQKVQSKGKTYYPVIAGPFLTEKQVQNALALLHRYKIQAKMFVVKPK